MGDCSSCILPDSSLKLHRKCRKVIAIIVFHMLNLIVQNGVSLQNQPSKDIISPNNVDINKSIDKMIIPSHNILPHNIMQTNLGLSWLFSSNNQVQTACEFHLNMFFVVSTLLLVDLTMASNSYAHWYLCKNLLLMQESVKINLS